MLNRETSVYLDIIRFSAAMAVFLGHVSGHRLTGGFLWQFGPYMSEAVTIFFVLSGFVIGYATDRRESTAGAYFVARAARIYSVALPALLITFFLDALGQVINPALYNGSWGYSADGQLWQFISGLFFVNRIWFSEINQGSDLPYWSLGYEVWYYIIFGIAAFAPVRWRALALAASLLLVGPKIVVMFPLWLLGLGCYHVCARGVINRFYGALLCGACAICWLGYEVWAWRYGRLVGFIPDLLDRPELLQDYLVGVLFAGHLLGFQAIAPAFSPLLRIARPVRWVSGATFTLYLLHLPVAQFLTTLLPWPPVFWASRIVIVGGTLLAVFVIAEVTERQKDWWRRRFAALLRVMVAPAI